jgi:hypothetical protein
MNVEIPPSPGSSDPSSLPDRGADPADHAPARALWWAIFLAVVVALLTPIFLTDLPPLLDYPNHLARMDILAQAGRDAALARMYRIDWSIVPNIGIDLLMPLFVRHMPLIAAGRLFLAAALLLPFFGVILLHRALFRVRSYWPLAAALVVYNRLFFLGFINFEIGLGLALLGAAAWTLLEGRRPARLASAIVLGIVIFFCHLIALGLYGLLLLALEGPSVLEGGRIRAKALLAPIAPLVLPAILYLLAPISRGDGAQPDGPIAMLRHYGSGLIAEHLLKPIGLFGGFLTYNRWLDAAAVLTIAALLVTSGRRTRLRPFVAGAAALLCALYPFVPFYLLKTAWIDQRLPVMATFLALAAIAPRIRGRSAGIALTALALIFLARDWTVLAIWRHHDLGIAQFRRDIEVVAPNERVLVVRPDIPPERQNWTYHSDTVVEMLDNDALLHVPALLVIDRRAFWPLLFTAAAKQPVRVLPPFDVIAVPEGSPPQVKDLTQLTAKALGSAPYLSDWQDHFDWVLLLNPGAVSDADRLLPGRLRLERRDELAALYRIVK